MTTVAILGFCAASARAEIYACDGDDGVTSYQDQPCPEPEPPAPEPEAVAEPDAPPREPPAPDTVEPLDAELVAACKKRYRDEIDRLDLELRNGFAPEDREAYREKLRDLSQQLSRCEYGGTNTSGGGQRSEPAGGDL